MEKQDKTKLTTGKTTPLDIRYIPEILSEISDEEITEILIIINKNIDNIKTINFKSYVEILDKFFNAEQTIESKLKEKNLKKKILKFFLKLMRNMLKEKLENYEFSYEVNSNIEYKYKKFLSEEIETLNDQIENLFNKSEEEPNKHLQNLTNLYFSIFRNSYMETKIPKFLLKKYKYQLSSTFSKLGKSYYNYNILFYNSNHKYRKEIDILNIHYREIIDNKKNLFDEKIFDGDLRKIFFKIIIFSNIDILKKNDLSKAIFMNNIKKYLILMNILQIEDNSILSYYVNMVDLLMNYSNEELNSEFFKTLSSIKRTFEDFQENKNSNILFLLLSFSLMFNNFFFALNNDTKELNNEFSLLHDNEYRVEFVPDFKYYCSAREREFQFNTNKCLTQIFNYSLSEDSKLIFSELNLYLEAIVFYDTFQYYSKNIFDKSTKIKIILDSKTIINLVSQNIKDNSFLYESWKILEQIINKPEKTLLRTIISNVSELIFFFKSKKSNIEDKQLKDEKVVVNIDIQNLKLIYNNPRLVSSNLYFFISGLFNKEPERFWDKIIYRYGNILDMYFYEWKSFYDESIDFYKYFSTNYSALLAKDLDKLQLSNTNIFNTSKSFIKIYGELLAFIIISRSIFKFQSINLVGFSIGAAIIKQCLKILNKFFKETPEAFDIIHNVIFIGGITNFKNNLKWNGIFKLVGGRIINVYSDQDFLLKSLFSKSNPLPIGLCPISNENKQIENYDVSDEKIDHFNYQENMDFIFEKIQII